jgi:8-oxo-dGTP pyrophosphatase MutT (NUDIX family)
MPGQAPRGGVRPVDAAGLVLIREDDDGPAVLMGRRHRGASFMPDVYVFPGGRIERRDAERSGFPEPLSVLAGARLSDAARRRLWPALRAAVRETYEETGLLFGRPTVEPPRAETRSVWHAFAGARLAPGFADLELVARAITPASMPKRFHTRFFLGDGRLVHGHLVGDGELVDLGWKPVGSLADLPLADVTAFVAQEALAQWRSRPALHVPLYCYVRDGAVVRRGGPRRA